MFFWHFRSCLKSLECIWRSSSQPFSIWSDKAVRSVGVKCSDTSHLCFIKVINNLISIFSDQPMPFTWNGSGSGAGVGLNGASVNGFHVNSSAFPTSQSLTFPTKSWSGEQTGNPFVVSTLLYWSFIVLIPQNWPIALNHFQLGPSSNSGSHSNNPFLWGSLMNLDEFHLWQYCVMLSACHLWIDVSKPKHQDVQGLAIFCNLMCIIFAATIFYPTWKWETNLRIRWRL